MPSTHMFDHEKLDVYRVSIELVSWVGTLLDGRLQDCKLSAVRQIDRASTSIPLNIAEGNGRRSLSDRCRFLDIARGSSLESAACLDVLVARGASTAEEILEGKRLLLRIVEMLYKMTQRLLGPEGERAVVEGE